MRIMTRIKSQRCMRKFQSMMKNKTKENNMSAKDEEGTPEETKETTKDKLIQNKKQEEKLKEDKKVVKTQKPKGKPKNSEKKGSCTKKGGEDNPWISFPCSV